MSRCTVAAVASGKGGVGKTLTSVNIAMIAARAGVRVAVVDADPLSNIMAMVDHPAPKRELPGVLEDPETQAYIVAPRFEVIFPQAKENPAQAAKLTAELLKNHRDWLNGRYGLVLVDMPAGTGAGTPFPYLAAVDALVLVTNPEPPAHVAAGAFLRAVMPLWAKRPVYVWHNKYEARPEEEFDPDDVVGNYNRNVPTEERIEPPALVPTAFVPPDPALDLNKADPQVLLNLFQALADTLRGIADAATPPLPQTGEEGSRSATLISYFLRRSPAEGDSESAILRLEKFLKEETGMGPEAALPEKLRRELARWFTEASESPLRRQVRKTLDVVELHRRDLESAGGFEGAPPKPGFQKAVDRELVPLLKTLSCLPTGSPMRSLASLLLFRYTLVKLFSGETARRLIAAFLPRRSEGGQSVRDRRRQVAGLVGKDSVYQGRYIALVKKLYPVISRQLDHLVETFAIQGLLFRNGDGTVARHAYVRLFSAAMYEIINGGLGVVAGFRFRPSSRAFEKGYETLMAHLAQGREP